MAQHLPLSVVLDTAVRSVFSAYGATYFTRLTAANPCRDTLSVTRQGDTIEMDHFDWLEAHFNNDTSVLKTLSALYAPDSTGMEMAEPVYLGTYAKNPHDPWAWTWPNYQKSLNMIGVNSAWDYEVGGPEHSVVAVIDNGLDYWRCDLGGGAIPNNKVIGGWDWAGYTDDCPTTNTAHPPSMQGFFHGLCSNGADHGTPIASIIGAYTNNYTCGGVDQGVAEGMAGIAGGWGAGGGFLDQGTGCKLVGYMVTDPGTCSKAKQAPRSDWAAASMLEASAYTAPLAGGHYGYGANMLNLSWYFQYSLPLVLRSAVSVAYHNGAQIVACTGNDFSSGYYYPADVEPASEVIAVGASLSSKVRASYSNWNKYVDLIAPGGYLSTADYIDYGLKYDAADCSTHSSGNADAAAYFDGTSFATPHVTGVLALLEHNLAVHHKSVYNQDYEGLLEASAEDLVTVNPPYDQDPDFSKPNYVAGFDSHVGWGFLKADNLFDQLYVQGYQLYNLQSEAYYSNFYRGGDDKKGGYDWGPLQWMMIYSNGQSNGLPTGKYKVRVRMDSAVFDFTSLNLDPSKPIYAWATATPKTGWANLTPRPNWDNWQEYWAGVRMDKDRDGGNGSVAGIYHNYAKKVTVYTYAYDVWDASGTKHIGIYPKSNGASSLYVSIYGVPCSGCKPSNGSQPLSSEDIVVARSTADHIELALGGSGEGRSVTVFDILGRTVWQGAVSADQRTVIVPTRELASGSYVVRVDSVGFSRSKEFVVNH